MKWKVSETGGRLWVASAVGVFAMVVVLWLSHANNNVSTTPAKTVPVLVAKSYIAAQTVLDASCCVEKNFPESYAPPRPILRKDFGNGAHLSRLRAKGEILKGEILTIARVTDGSGSNASWNIGDGEAAVTLHLTPEAAMSGVLAPGDVVNVMVTFDKRLCIEVSNVSVLAVGKRSARNVDETTGSSDDTLVTLLLDTKQALRVTLAAQKQTVSLALTSPLGNPTTPACVGINDL